MFEIIIYSLFLSLIYSDLLVNLIFHKHRHLIFIDNLTFCMPVFKCLFTVLVRTQVLVHSRCFIPNHSFGSLDVENNAI